MTVSRRTLLLVMGGLAAAPLAWKLVSPPPGDHTAPAVVADCCDYADYEGWLVTPAEKARLVATEEERRAGEETSAPAPDAN